MWMISKQSSLRVGGYGDEKAHGLLEEGEHMHIMPV